MSSISVLISGIVFGFTTHPLILLGLISSACLPELFGSSCLITCIENKTQVCVGEKCCIHQNLPCDTSVHDTTCVKTQFNTGCQVPYYVGLKCDYRTFDIAFFSLFLLTISSGVYIIVCLPFLIGDIYGVKHKTEVKNDDYIVSESDT